MTNLNGSAQEGKKEENASISLGFGSLAFEWKWKDIKKWAKWHLQHWHDFVVFFKVYYHCKLALVYNLFTTNLSCIVLIIILYSHMLWLCPLFLLFKRKKRRIFHLFNECREKCSKVLHIFLDLVLRVLFLTSFIFFSFLLFLPNFKLNSI